MAPKKTTPGHAGCPGAETTTKEVAPEVSHAELLDAILRWPSLWLEDDSFPRALLGATVYKQVADSVFAGGDPYENLYVWLVLLGEVDTYCSPLHLRTFAGRDLCERLERAAQRHYRALGNSTRMAGGLARWARGGDGPRNVIGVQRIPGSVLFVLPPEPCEYEVCEDHDELRVTGYGSQ
jgi:hypothetical protein